MDYPKFIVSNQMDEFISIPRVKQVPKSSDVAKVPKSYALALLQ